VKRRERVRIITDWCDYNADYFYRLQYCRCEGAKILWWTIKPEWITEHTTYDRSKAEKWAQHHGVPITPYDEEE